MGKKISVVTLIISILLIGTIIIGSSYSLWTTTNNQQTTNTINVGCFAITFSDSGIAEAGDIYLGSAYPISDNTGKALRPYKFNIKNDCSVAANYVVNLETLNTTTMDESNLDVYFNESMVQSYNNTATVGVSADASSAMQLTTGYLAANEDVTYSLRVWIDYDVTMDTPNVAGKTWNGRVVVSSEATGLKPSLENKVVTSESVTFDAVVNNGYQVSSITCYYGDEGNLVNEGTAIGTSQCVFPTAAEYAKVCMTYPSNTVECSDEYLIEDISEHVLE